MIMNDDYFFSEKKDKPLTDREKQVLILLCQGYTNKQIGKILNISSYTAKAHVCSILQKLDAKDRVQAAVKAVRLGLV